MYLFMFRSGPDLWSQGRTIDATVSFACALKITPRQVIAWNEGDQTSVSDAFCSY